MMEPGDRSEAPTESAPVDNTSPEVPLGAGLDLSDPNSPLAPFYLGLSHLVALAILILFVFYARILPLSGYGLWAQLALGRWTVENKTVPTSDPLSEFSDPDVPLPAAGWLARVLFYLVYRFGAALAGGSDLTRLAGGVEMLHLAHMILVLGFGILTLWAYSRRTGSLPLACLGLVLLIVPAPALINTLRPFLLGILCFLALLGLLGKQTLSWRSVAVVIPLLVMWANLDLTFVVGFCLIALLLVGQLIENPRDPRTIRLLVALVGSIVMVGVCTPDGLTLYPRLWTWATSPPLADLLYWQPLNFSEWRIVHFLFLATLVMLTLAPVASRQEYSPTQMVVLVGFCVLALWKQVAVAWWFLIVPWLLLPQLVALGQRLSWQGATVAPPCLRKTFVGVLMGLAVCLLMLPLSWMRAKEPRPLSLSLAPDIPWQVVARLQEPDATSGPLSALAGPLRAGYSQGQFIGRILANDTASDFFLFALPEHSVWVYSEVELFDTKHWQEYHAIYAARTDWWELLDRHRVNLIVFNPKDDAKLAEAIEEDPAWVIVEETGKRAIPWRVALRKRPMTR